MCTGTHAICRDIDDIKTPCKRDIHDIKNPLNIGPNMPNKDFFLTSGKEARARCLFSTSSLAADERIKRTRIGQGQRQVHKTHLQQSPIFN